MAKYLDENGLSRFWTKIKDFLTGNYQSKLISGTNIKTVNNQSLLGSGNIATSGGSDSFVYENPASVTIEEDEGNTIMSIDFSHKPDPTQIITIFWECIWQQDQTFWATQIKWFDRSVITRNTNGAVLSANTSLDSYTLGSDLTINFISLYFEGADLTNQASIHKVSYTILNDSIFFDTEL